MEQEDKRVSAYRIAIGAVAILALLLSCALAVLLYKFYEGRYETVVSESFQDGSTYSGQVRRGRRVGFGVAAYPDGRRYEGFWKEDIFCGKGTLSYPDGLSYEGVWVDGRLEDAEISSEEFHYSGAVKFMPDSVRVIPDGFGRMVYNITGEVYVGNWKDGNRHSLGRLFRPDGTYSFGRWSSGSLVVPSGKSFADGDRVYGVDISHHQKHISWDILALYCNASGTVYSGKAKSYTYARPVDFVYMKATEGESHKDTKYLEYVQNARTHYIPKGAYHFFKENVGAAAQMRNFFSVAVFDRGDMPPALDVELDPKVAKNYGEKRLRDSILVCLKMMEEHFGVRPIIYTGDRARSSYMDDDCFAGYDFWLARYGKEPQNEKYRMWQFSQGGQMSGLKREYDIDLDEFMGTYRSFRNYIYTHQKTRY